MSFPDKKKKRLKEYISTESAFQEMLKELLYDEERGSENTGTKRKMAISKYLPIITLNVNGLNAPIERHRVAVWIRKHDPLHAVYKRTTSK